MRWPEVLASADEKHAKTLKDFLNQGSFTDVFEDWEAEPELTKQEAYEGWEQDDIAQYMEHVTNLAQSEYLFLNSLMRLLKKPPICNLYRRKN